MKIGETRSVTDKQSYINVGRTLIAVYRLPAN